MKYLLSAVLLSICFISTAQVDEEVTYLTGGIGFSSGDASAGQFGASGGEDVSISLNTFNINLGGGYMFSEMFGAGLKVDFMSSGFSSGDFADSLFDGFNSNMLTLTPHARMYLEIDEPLYFTADLNVGFGFGNPGVENVSPVGGSDSIPGASVEVTDASQSLFTVNVRPGLTYFVSDNFAIDLTMGFIGFRSFTTETTVESSFIDPQGDRVTQTNTGEATTSSFEAMADLTTAQIGVTLFLGT